MGPTIQPEQPDKEEALSFEEALPRVSEWRRFSRVFFGRKVVILGFVIITLLIIAAAFAPFLAPYDPAEMNLKEALQYPSKEHWLGTDPLGRDLLSRLVYGTRTSLQVGIVAVGIASVIGVTLGLVSAYFGGWLDNIIMRVIDAFISIPPLVLGLTLGAVLGGGLRSVMIAVGISLMPLYCRLMRGMALSVKQSDYFMAARVLGASSIRVILKHVLPNCLSALIVLITLNLGIAILAEAALSFLGVGIAPPGAAWGAMISDGYQYLLTHPLLSFAPGMCILLVVLSFNMVGDGLRDALDPGLRGTL